MLSKAKGQVLRVSAVLHVLFCDGIDDKGELTVHEVPTVVESKAVVAARNFVNTCCQHAAFVAGRGLIDDEITQLTSSKPQTLLNLNVTHTQCILAFIAGSMVTTPNASSLVSYCLLLPGKKLHLSALLTAKKFRGKGNKDGAVAAFREIADAGLGMLSTEESRRGTSAVSGVLCYA